MLQVGASMGDGGSRKARPSSASSAPSAVHRFGVGTAGAAEAAYPSGLRGLDPNALLYSQNSKPYGKQVGAMGRGCSFNSKFRMQIQSWAFPYFNNRVACIAPSPPETFHFKVGLCEINSRL